MYFMLGNDIRFDGPGRYGVRIKEDVSPGIIELFNVKKNITELAGSGNTGSQLIVEIKDQSELLSFLNTLYDNHYTIMKIELLTNMKNENSSVK